MLSSNNRVSSAITRYDERVAKLNGVGLNGKPVDSLHEAMRLTHRDFVDYQYVQAQGHALGIISPAEAQTIYLALGGEVYHPDWSSGTSIGAKTAITQFISEILEAIRKRRGFGIPG